MAPKSEKTKYQDDVKKTSKIKRPGTVQQSGSRPKPRVGGSLKSKDLTPSGTIRAHNMRPTTLHEGTRPGGGYIYIYMYSYTYLIYIYK